LVVANFRIGTRDMTTAGDDLWSIDALLAATGAQADGPATSGITGVSIDSRTIGAGELFVALTDQRDGHDFVEAAFRAGAGAALVSTAYQRKPGDGLLLRVADPLAALVSLGSAARARLAREARVIAVTGSAGKTTTKEMLAACCRRLGPAHASEKSYNNHWGVPLTLARMPAATHFAIFEIGMNHAGEITPLVALVRPDVAIVTTVVAAHLEHFGSEEAIADAKAEIFSGLAPGGTAVINYDNRHFERLRTAALARPGVKVVPFSGKVRPAHDIDLATMGLGLVRVVRAHPVDGQTLVEAHGLSFVLGALGEHMVANAVAVLAALKAAGADVAAGLRALADFAPPQGRGSRQPIAAKGGTALLVDESYNANPASMRAALSTLGDVPRSHHPRRVAVLGDMLELGPEAAALHAGLGDAIDAAGVDLVFAAGPNMRHLYDALPEGRRGGWAETVAGIRDQVLGAVAAGDVVMVKGSNGSKTWQLVEALKARPAAGTN
jgi:UDP-N-acetylmuramoyl-tripeptide--D-alanyl-D-alanine ligase